MNEISCSKCDFEKMYFFVKIRECKIFNRNFEYVHPYAWPHCHYPDYTHEKFPEMNILESKYAKICTFIIFILKIILIFRPKMMNLKSKTKEMMKILIEILRFCGVFEMCNIS